MTLDIKNFYLNTPLAQYEYVWLKLGSFTEDVINNMGSMKNQQRMGGYTPK